MITNETIVDILFATFIDTISITYIISSHTIFELSAILFKYLTFLQIHMLKFQLESFLRV